MRKPAQAIRSIMGAILLLGATVASIVQQPVAVATPPSAAGGAVVQDKPRIAATAGGNDADEKAIRATADEFVKAFNAADAKAIGALWAPDAEYTDESGQSFQGRAAIEQVYADVFKQHLARS